MQFLDFEVVSVNPQGEVVQRDRLTSSYHLEPAIALTMAAIPAGTFLMGSPSTEEGFHPSQSPQHSVNLQEFWMSQFPITQAQWRSVAKLPAVKQSLSAEPANFSENNRPVEQVSWFDAIEFCARLSHFFQKTYHLPSEAQWEYACRAIRSPLIHASCSTWGNPKTALAPLSKGGTEGGGIEESGVRSYPFHFGETLTTELANYSGVNWEYQGKICSKGSYGAGPLGEDRRETTPVGAFGVANAFGLYDMHGLVREWCADVWHPTYAGAPTDGTAWMSGGDSNKRVLRGGSWNSSPQKCRSAYRGKFDPSASLYDIGFRIVCVD